MTDKANTIEHLLLLFLGNILCQLNLHGTTMKAIYYSPRFDYLLQSMRLPLPPLIHSYLANSGTPSLMSLLLSLHYLATS